MEEENKVINCVGTVRTRWLQGDLFQRYITIRNKPFHLQHFKPGCIVEIKLISNSQCDEERHKLEMECYNKKEIQKEKTRKIKSIKSKKYWEERKRKERESLNKEEESKPNGLFFVNKL